MWADERKIKQVLLNLLSNAVKFTPEGGRITVSAGVDNEEASVSVTDTGIGIAPEHHALVFEEFRQVGHADRKAEGTPSEAAVRAFTVNSDASAPLIVSRMILPLKLCASGLLSVPAAS